MGLEKDSFVAPEAEVMREAKQSSSLLAKLGLSSESGHFAALDGLRALAALMIVALHVGFYSGSYFSGPWGAPLANLSSSVAIFFVLSGFLLYRPFVKAHLAGTSPPSTKTYLWRRFLRIMPAYWLALTYCGFVLDRVDLAGWDRKLVHYSLMRIYWSKYFFDGMTQVWTLSVEVSFYLALPMIAWAIFKVVSWSRLKPLHAQVAAICTLMAGSLLLRWFLLATHDTSPISTKWLPASFDWFGLGMLLAALAAGVDLGLVSVATVRRIFDRVWPWWLAGAAVLGLASFGISDSRQAAILAVDLSDGADMAQHVLYGLMGFCLVAPIAVLPSGRGLIRRLLGSLPVVVIGIVSYGIFLYHEPLVAELVEEHSLMSRVRGAPFVGAFVAVILVSTLAALVSWVFVEHPLQILRRRLRLRRG